MKQVDRGLLSVTILLIIALIYLYACSLVRGAAL